jgi:glycyl-tRNA synthetase beta chain
LGALTGLPAHPTLGSLLQMAASGFPERATWDAWPPEDLAEMNGFLIERLRNFFEARGFDRRNVRAVTWDAFDQLRPAEVAAKLDALPDFASSTAFNQLATAFKRVKNIARELRRDAPAALDELERTLRESAEKDLLRDLQARIPRVREAAGRRDYRAALNDLAALGPAVDRFFVDVLVMADDPGLRRSRLSLMAHLRDVVLDIADVSEIVTEERQA